MSAIQDATVYGILHLTGFDHGVDRQQVDLKIFTCHGVHAIDVALGVFKENAATPGRLDLESNGSCTSDVRHRNCAGSTGNGNCTAFNEFAACYLLFFLFHLMNSPLG